MNEWFFRIWIQLTKNPVYKAFIRRAVFTLIFVGVLAGVALYATRDKNKKQLANRKEVSRTRSDGSLMSSYDYAFLANDPESYRAAYFDSEVAQDNGDSFPEAAIKLDKRIKIARKFSEVAVKDGHKHLAAKLLLTDQIFREKLSLQNDAVDYSGAEELISTAKKMQNSEDAETKELAAVGRVYGAIRKFSELTDPDKRKADLPNVAATISEQSGKFQDSRLVSKQLFRLMEFTWLEFPQEEAVTFAEAYCEGFRESRYEWTIDSVKKMRKTIASTK